MKKVLDLLVQPLSVLIFAALPFLEVQAQAQDAPVYTDTSVSCIFRDDEFIIHASNMVDQETYRTETVAIVSDSIVKITEVFNIGGLIPQTMERKETINPHGFKSDHMAYQNQRTISEKNCPHISYFSAQDAEDYKAAIPNFLPELTVRIPKLGQK